MKVVGVRDEPWGIPGTRLVRPSKAVTVQALEPAANGTHAVAETWTQHAYRVGSGGWAWIVAAAFMEDVRRDAC